jgi:hypothetical protein
MSQVSILVSTHDRYRAVWPPFCHGLRKYWPDCPWPVWFVTNRLKSPCGLAVRTGRDANWTRMLRAVLERIDSPVILYLHEDYWLDAPVDTPALEAYASLVAQGKADYVGLYPSWSNPKVRRAGACQHDPRLSHYAPDSAYRTSLQAAFWRRGYFQGLLRDGESPWQFERNSNARVVDGGRHLCVEDDSAFHYPLRPKGGPVYRGEWTRDAVVYAEREGLSIDFSRHPKDY